MEARRSVTASSGRTQAVALLVAVLAGALVPTVDFPIGRIVGAGLLLGAVVVTRRRLGPALLSPVWIVVVIYVALAAGGALFYDNVADAAGGAAITLQLSGPTSRDTYWLLLTATAALLAGATAVSSFHRTPRSGAAITAIRTSGRVKSLLMVGAIVPLVMIVLGVGPAQLLLRDRYLSGAPGGIAGVATKLAVASAIGLGYLASQRLSPSRRTVVWLLAVAYGLVFFSLGSRTFALLPVLLAGGAYAGSLSKRSKVTLLVSVFAGLYLVQLPLYLRSLENHGLVPYSAALPGFVNETLRPDVVAKTVLISYGTIGQTAFQEPPIPLNDLWISVNPMPGTASGWYEIRYRHRLNAATPYPALGELANAGRAHLVTYFLVVGAVLAYLDLRIRAYTAQRRPGLPLALLGLVALFAVYSVQYTLRSANRLLLYALLIDLAARAVAAWRPRRTSPGGVDELVVPSSGSLDGDLVTRESLRG